MSRAAVAVVVLVSVVFVGGFVLACTGVRWGSLCRVGVGLGVGCGGVRLLAAMGEGCAHNRGCLVARGDKGAQDTRENRTNAHGLGDY